MRVELLLWPFLAAGCLATFLSSLADAIAGKEGDVASGIAAAISDVNKAASDAWDFVAEQAIPAIEQFADKTVHELERLGGDAISDVDKAASNAWGFIVDEGVPPVRQFLEKSMHEVEKLGGDALGQVEEVKALVDQASEQINRLQVAFEQGLHDKVANPSPDEGPIDRETFDARRASTNRRVLDEIERAFHGILSGLKNVFPPPSEAPTHEERDAIAVHILEEAGNVLVDILSTKFELIPETLLRDIWAVVSQIVRTLVVTIGDFAEQHPILLSFLLWKVVEAIIPQIGLARLLLDLLGFGMKGPIKDTAASWVQSALFGGAVPSGSWFSQLQRAGMKIVL